MKKIGLAVGALLLASTMLTQAAGPGSRVPPGIISGNTNAPTYSTSISGLANTGAGDLFCISGVANRQIYLKGVRVSAAATAGIIISATLVARSTLDTGGTSTSPAAVPHDPLNDASVAVIKAYTVSPTAGTLIGQIRTEKLAIGTPGNAVLTDTALFQFSVYWDQAPILRDALHSYCVNFPVAAGTGASIDIDAEWTELP